MSKFLDENGLLYFWEKIKNAISGKVDKVEGKGLSSNDFTTEEKTKLAGIATGANKITVDSALSSSSTNPVQNKAVNSALALKLSIATAESTYAKKTDIANTYKYKGTVASYANLPTSATAGDVYNVTDTGKNYAWTGSAWDDLGGTFGVDPITNSEIDTIVAS